MVNIGPNGVAKKNTVPADKGAPSPPPAPKKPDNNSPGFNNGPAQDTFTPSNNLFAGSLDKPNAGNAGGPGYKPAGGDKPGETDPNKPAGGGTGSEYVDTMMKAFDDLNAPQELKDAYMEQYRLLGLIGGGETPAGPTNPADPTNPTNPANPTKPTDPTKPTNPTEPGRVATSGGNNAGNPADAPPESEVFTNAGKIDWAGAPAALKHYQQEIISASEITGVPESIIGAAIWAESRGNLDAVTNAGMDKGLMQVNDQTYATYIAGQHGLPQQATTPTDPANNILAGATYLKQLKDGPTAGLPDGGFGTWDMAMRAYNSGEFSGVDFSNPDKKGPSGTGKDFHVEATRQFIAGLMAGDGLPDSQYNEASFRAAMAG